jgi:O-glycosyl hydrolase
MNLIQRALICSIGLSIFGGELMAQVECSGWGELRGIRIDGQLVPVITSIEIVGPGWKQTAQTAHWKTRKSTYAREGKNIITTGQLGLGARAPQLVSFRQTASDTSPGAADIKVEITADTDVELAGAYIFVSVPAADFGHGNGELFGASPAFSQKLNFATTRPANERKYVTAIASGARFSAAQTVEVKLDEPREIVVQDDRGTAIKQLTLFFPIHIGNLKRGETAKINFSINITGDIDRTPAHIAIDPSKPGSPFAGIGGNLCWELDSPTVNYYLDHLKVVWTRVSFPMPLWQPLEHSDPTTQPTEQLPGELQTDLKIATEIHRRKLPMILTVWTAPDWAVIHRPTNNRGFGGPSIRQNIDPKKWDALADSIGKYLLRFKQVVGAEPDLFSFNESNLGINVALTPTQHRDAIKLLGAKFESLGLRTKILLGDANEPRAVDYVKAALADPQAMKYVGMVSYHSWNGGTEEQLTGWHKHAVAAGLPLIVAEAGFDPDASHYRTILNETWYALDEIKLNLQCITFSQPVAILHWQFTPDYGLVTGGTSAEDPIKTSQRWWQYKQLSERTPPNAAVLPMTTDRPEIVVSALAATGQGVSAIHIANSGAARPTTITGIPQDIKEMHCWITDENRSMKEIEPAAVSNGTVTITVPAQSFLTLTHD